jgi:hypothetical protein
MGFFRHEREDRLVLFAHVSYDTPNMSACQVAKPVNSIGGLFVRFGVCVLHSPILPLA